MSTRHERFADKSLNERHSQILKALMQRPENRRCADCRKKDPRWASWNLGIFVCIRCSGVHRSLGTHISKVKSADLDAWTPEQIENMVKWGNAKANWYWEQEMPKNMEPPESAMDGWIRGKYERKQFVKRGSQIPDPDTIILGDGQDSDVQKIITQQKPVSKAPSIATASDTLAIAPPSNFVSPPTLVATQKTASDDLFEAFQAAPSVSVAQQPDATMQLFQTTPPVTSTPQQPNQSTPQQTASSNSMKASIMSLYNTKPTNSPVIGSAQQSSPSLQPQFGNSWQNSAKQPDGAQFFGGFADFSGSFAAQPQNSPKAAPSNPTFNANNSGIPSFANFSTPATQQSTQSTGFASFGTTNSSAPKNPLDSLSDLSFSQFDTLKASKVDANKSSVSSLSDDWGVFQ